MKTTLGVIIGSLVGFFLGFKGVIGMAVGAIAITALFL